MKILDRYILTTYVKTFLSTFVVLMFIFVLQSVWLHIQELAGKGLDVKIILKFLTLAIPIQVVFALPLSVLLTSIMTFGNLAENYEFAAMKSTGISLQRSMKSLIIFIIGLSLITFFFANYAIPASQLEFLNLRRNIAKAKPALAIIKGQFNAIGNDINIKIADKYGDRDQYLTDVIIHKKDPTRIGNYTVIKASKGEFISSVDDPVLSLQLQDGNYYDEVKQKDLRKKSRVPFVKSYFETYTLNIDLSVLDNVDYDAKDIDNNYKMLNIKDLDSNIVRKSKRFNKELREFGNIFIKGANFQEVRTKFKSEPKDSVSEVLLENYELKERVQILELARSNISNNLTTIENQKNLWARRVKELNKFEIAIHDKYVLAFSCIILFFVGAPLGAIIRKGGLGLPIVIGVVLFLTYHFVGIFAKNSAEDDSISPFVASWLSTFIMLPLGVYLTYRATTDQGLFDLDGLIEPIKRLFEKKDKNVHQDNT